MNPVWQQTKQAPGPPHATAHTSVKLCIAPSLLDVGRVSSAYLDFLFSHPCIAQQNPQEVLLSEIHASLMQPSRPFALQYIYASSHA
mmetsp:Transcript_4893/g.13349  ORF Transcript_4893/g.13349 Transcript_4893/m.13349 type:complete len:87 (+) Transcript_4893:441-701(+)